MSAYHQVFLRPRTPHGADAVVPDIQACAGAQLETEGSDYADYAGGIKDAAFVVKLSHEYDDDYDIPFSQYPVCVTIRQYDRNEARQEDLARGLFANLKRLGRYDLLLVFDLYKLLDRA